MPIHNWTRVYAGVFHSFHNAWITHLKERLNAGLLPDPYYAFSEQRADSTRPDMLALRIASESEDIDDLRYYLAKRRTLVIRHATGDRIVALVEIVSPANKHSREEIVSFVDKVLAALRQGIHVLVIDPFPPTRHDPQGIHGLMWEKLGEPRFDLPADRDRTMVSYCAKSPIMAYVEPTRVGLPLTEMPMFLTKTHYIRMPLEATYMQAWAGVPQRWRSVVEGGVG